jgi:hypothetical protein
MKRAFRRQAFLSKAVLGLAMMASAVTPWLAATQAQARPLTPAEKRFLPWSGDLPACDDPGVLGRIQMRFSQAENGYWQSGLEIVSFDTFREIGYRTTGADYIPRRYCTASAQINDGKVRQVSYWVGEDLGFSGGDYALVPVPFASQTSLLGNWGVTYCVNGLDRNYAYGPDCRAARP